MGVSCACRSGAYTGSSTRVKRQEPFRGKGIELLRVVHSQLLDYSEGGEGAATPGPPDLPVEGDKDKKKVVKEESEPEVEKADVKKGEAPVVVPEEGQASSPGGGGEPEPAKEEGLKEEKKRVSHH